MIITVAGYKGGVGKTTTAVHLAAYCQTKGPALLLDGDPNRSATAWHGRGGLPFAVIDERQFKRYMADDFKHIIVDTEARLADRDSRALAARSDLIIVPSSPDALALAALLQTVGDLEAIGAKGYRVLLTSVPPKPSRDGDEARAMLKGRGVPVFKGMIHRRVAFPKAALAGVTVRDVRDPRAALAWEEYEQVGKEAIR